MTLSKNQFSLYRSYSSYPKEEEATIIQRSYKDNNGRIYKICITKTGPIMNKKHINCTPV